MMQERIHGSHNFNLKPRGQMAENPLADALKKRRQISITVIGRRSGRSITIPVWFVYDGKALWLLPVYGSQTQWYQNLQAKRAITIRIGKQRHDLRSRLLKNPRAVRNVIRSFQEKYTPEQIKRWYSGLDVAVQVPIRST